MGNELVNAPNMDDVMQRGEINEHHQNEAK
jgi:hypothetical protein